MPKRKLILKQIVVAPWQNDKGQANYSIFGLGTDGLLYRQARAAGGWKAMSMRILTENELSSYYKDTLHLSENDTRGD